MKKPQTTADADTVHLRWIKPLLAVAFCLVFAAGFGTISMAFRATSAERMVTQNYEIRQNLDVLMSNLEDAETGQRGFLLTSNSNYLQPFHRAEAAIPPTLRLLNDLTAKDASQNANINDLSPLIDAKLGELRETIALEHQGQHQAAIAIVMSDKGKDLMDDIRTHVDAIAKQEVGLLALRQRKAAGLRSGLVASVCVSLLVAVGVAGLLARGMLRAILIAQTRAAELEAESKLRRQTEESLRQAEKMEAVGQLTGGIAHDFNNLLTVVKSNSEDMLDDLKDTPILRDQAKIVLEAADRGAAVVAQLMAFARKQELEPRPVNLNAFLDGFKGRLRGALPESVEIKIFAESSLPLVQIDGRRLETAMLSLVNNARDAMPAGGTLTIEAGLKMLDAADPFKRAEGWQEEYVMLAVTDTGTGMTKDVLKHAFVPFFTTKDVGKGSGLGLSTVYGFVKQSGGNAQIYSEAGFGTVVKIYLPTGGKAAASPVEAIDSPQVDIQKGKVLLVEDDQIVRENTSRNLARLGYTVTTASHATEAIEIITNSPHFDFVFSDVIMPGSMSGSDLAREIQHRWPSTRIILTSGYAKSALEKLALPKDVRFLSKPYSSTDLAAAFA